VQIINHSQHLRKRKLDPQLRGDASRHPSLVLRIQPRQLSPKGDEGGIVGLTFWGPVAGKGVCCELLSVFSLPFLKGLLELNDTGFLLRDDPSQRSDQLLVLGAFVMEPLGLAARLHR
jgi:hypothetical protein